VTAVETVPDTVPELLISSDSHAQVSHDAVKAHLATRFHAEYDGAVKAFQQRMAKGAGRVNQSWQSDRKRDEDASSFRLRNMTRPGHHDGAARLADMDADGVQQEVIYSEVSAFRYIRDLHDGQSEATVAFNEALREFGAADPDRLIVSYQIPIHDIDAAVHEVRRVAGLGAKSLQLPVFPPEVGLPDYYHERYDPLFAVIQEAGLPICCHIGLNTMLDDLVARDPTPGSAVMVPMAALSTGEALGMWIMGGVFERFPGLKVVFVEPGLGWIAWWLFITDDMVTRQGYELPAITELPSFYFHRNVFVTFIDETDAVTAPQLRNRIGVENMMWSSDYPHPVTSWPNSRRVVAETLGVLTPEERELVVAGNARRVWNL
jgi:predicted TIM-barrel fold metal-dependent hydrolase